MKKEVKTRIAFISIYSLVPIVVIFELGYISQCMANFLLVLLSIIFFTLGKDFIKDIGKLPRM